MNVTRDVMHDLLTVYLAGEASADTRALVEEYLATDPGMARAVESARAGGPPLPAVPPPAPEAEKRTLDATRQLLRTQTSTLVVATVFTLLPLSFVFRDGRVTFLLIRDAPVVGLAWWGTAAVLWVIYSRLRRRLRVPGL